MNKLKLRLGVVAVAAVMIFGITATAFAAGTTDVNTTSPLIGVDAAKTIALDDSGLTASQVTFAQQEVDWEDGRQVYEIEFYTSGGMEYDYEIDAFSGTVISFDYDAENYTNTTSAGSYIGGDQS